mgnify:CR=1 FL=1
MILIKRFDFYECMINNKIENSLDAQFWMFKIEDINNNNEYDVYHLIVVLIMKELIKSNLSLIKKKLSSIILLTPLITIVTTSSNVDYMHLISIISR